MASFIKTDDHITITFNDGTPATVLSSDPRWDDLIAAVVAKDWDRAREITFPANKLKSQLEQHEASFGRVTVEDGVVFFEDTPMHTTLTDRMLEMLNEGFDIEPMARFLDNLMDNPSYRAINELYDFLEASKLPITEDGHFLAYKRVRDNYTDIYSGKFDNSVGAVCQMARNMVDEDKDRTCSAGLHFCGREYLGFYGCGPSNRTMVVKINPADVVAIPSDHDNMKGRTAKYEVIDELEPEQDNRDFPEESLEGAFRPIFDDGEDLDDEFGFADADEFEQAFLDEELSNNEFGRKHPDAVVSLRPLDKFTSSFDVNINDRMIARYKSPKAASEVVPGAYSSNIKRCAEGIRKTAGGVEWMYMEDYLVSLEIEQQDKLSELLAGILVSLEIEQQDKLDGADRFGPEEDRPHGSFDRRDDEDASEPKTVGGWLHRLWKGY